MRTPKQCADFMISEYGVDESISMIENYTSGVAKRKEATDFYWCAVRNIIQKLKERGISK